MALRTPVFSAVSSSTRQILLLLRCISFSKRAQVRISAEGLRFSTEEGSAMESVVFLDKALFTSYTFNTSSAAEDPAFEISLLSLLEALNIFALSDPSVVKRPGGGAGEFDSFAAHRLQRHAGLTLGVTGICSFRYTEPGAPLAVHMTESGVATTCELTTYDLPYQTSEDIPFNREDLALKTILRSSYLSDAIAELSALNPSEIDIIAVPDSAGRSSRLGTGSSLLGTLTIAASGALGEASIDFTATSMPAGHSSTVVSSGTDLDDATDTRIVETFNCPARMRAHYRFSIWKAAQRAMTAASKVSLRIDLDGVLSLQFLVEVDMPGSAGDGIAFVDFRAVPLVDDDTVEADSGSSDTE